MNRQIPIICCLFSAIIIGVCFWAQKAEAQSSRFGCYVIKSGALNIRKRAWARSPVVAVVRRGERVAKRRRFCALRGFWCPVRTKSGVSGWADKKYLVKGACPP